MLEAANFPFVPHPLYNKSLLLCFAMTAAKQPSVTRVPCPAVPCRALPCRADCTALRANETMQDGKQCHLHTSVIFFKFPRLLCELQKLFKSMCLMQMCNDHFFLKDWRDCGTRWALWMVKLNVMLLKMWTTLVTSLLSLAECVVRARN